MKRYFEAKPKITESSMGSTSNTTSNAALQAQKQIQVLEFNPNDIVRDPGLRKQIDEYDINIRDQVRKEYLRRGPYQPVGHNFPRTKQGRDSRRFHENWYEKFDWLEYSVEKDAAYCFYCYLFDQQRSNRFGSDAFTKRGFNNWKKVMAIFTEHVGTANSNHNNARLNCEAFKIEMQIVSHIFSLQNKGMKVDDRTHLKHVLRILRSFLLQGIDFCGLDDFVTLKSEGNILEMLSWYVNEVERIENVGSGNASWNHPMHSIKIQNELVRACAEQTMNVISDEIEDSNFSILVNVSYDKSDKEQMSVIARFVNKHGQVIERFVGVEHVSDTSVASLKYVLDSVLSRHGLSISRLRGQGYDGILTTGEQFNVLKTSILKENPRAFHVHWFAQPLQAVIIYVVKSIPVVCNFFHYIYMLVNIVGATCRRSDELLQKHYEDIIENLNRPAVFVGRDKYQETQDERLSDTRWGSYYTSLVRLFTMWDSILEVLQVVYDDGIDAEQRGASAILIEKLESFDFVFILHLMMRILGLTNDLSRILQENDQHIVNAMDLILIVKDLVKDVKENGWDSFLEEVKRFCVKMSIPVPNMEDKIPVKGRSRREGQWITCYRHYHNEVFIVVIDLIVAELNNRFNETSIELLRCIACLDPRNSFSKFDHSKLLRLAEIYSYDFSNYDRLILKDQLCVYIGDVRKSFEFASCHDLASLAIKMVETEKHLIFSLVYRLIELALILPVAPATIERAFSSMNFMKRVLHKKSSDELFGDLMTCYIERDILAEIKEEKVLQCFQNMQKRIIQVPPSGH